MGIELVSEHTSEPPPSKQKSQRDLLKLILPVRDAPYVLDQIEEILRNIHVDIESQQRKNNDLFDLILDEPVREKLKCLTDNLDKTQEDILKLKFNIADTRKLYFSAKNACNDKVVQEREQMLQEEKTLRRSLQQSKFNSVVKFFEQFVVHLEGSIEACRRFLAQSSAANYLQALDWGQYHQVMFLLRACGQSMIDLDKFERLYQSTHKDYFGLSFRLTLDKIDLNNFIEFHVTHSLETQLDVVVNSQGDRVEFGQFIKDPKIEKLLSPTNSLEYELFKPIVDKLGAITIECCHLLVDLNLNYIEAHFTDGINIDRLNGCDTTALPSSAPNQVLPSYAFSPQEYITQIGQHLMTLKKQTEKFDHIDNRPLLLALDSLRFVKQFPFDASAFKTVTYVILQYISRQAVRSLVGRTTPSVLSQLTANGRKQLATDAAYLNSVLEDLNLLDISDPPVEKFKALFAQ